MNEKRNRALERELAKLKVEKDRVEHKLQSEKGIRFFDEQKINMLKRDLQESQDLVAQLVMGFAGNK